MKLEEFNSLSPKEAWDQLFKCCGCTHWANNVVEHLPFKSIESLKFRIIHGGTAGKQTGWRHFHTIRKSDKRLQRKNSKPQNHGQKKNSRVHKMPMKKYFRN
jgi:hypothetical protein